MTREEHRNFLDRKLSSVLNQLAESSNGLVAPIKLETVAEHLGVRVEWRRMIPEGTFHFGEDGVLIAMQKDFLEMPGVAERQRFTLAHEICHSLLFDFSCKPPKPLKCAPCGERLESLCNWGAARLLIPQRILKELVTRWTPITSSRQIDELASRFDVSREVMIRRLADNSGELVGDGLAILTTESFKGIEVIQSACHNTWIAPHFTKPKRGMDFEKWSEPFFRRAIQSGESQWVHPATGITISKEYCGNRKTQVVISRE